MKSGKKWKQRREYFRDLKLLKSVGLKLNTKQKIDKKILLEMDPYNKRVFFLYKEKILGKTARRRRKILELEGIIS